MALAVWSIVKRLDEIKITTGSLDDQCVGITDIIVDVEGFAVEEIEIYATASFFVYLRG